MGAFSSRLNIAQNRKGNDGRRQHANGGKQRNRKKSGAERLPGKGQQRPARIAGQQRGRINRSHQRTPCRARQFHRHAGRNGSAISLR